MARRKTITDEQILQAARAVFLEEGFSAQTAKIAQRADVSEGTIFKRFPTKEALFFAALDADREVPWLAVMERQLGIGDIRENLLSLFVNIILYFHRIFPGRMVTFGSLRVPPHLFEGLDEHPIVFTHRRLGELLKVEMDLGRLRSCDSILLSHIICGSLISHVTQEMMTGQDLTEEQMRVIAEGTLSLIWNGIGPPKAGKPRRNWQYLKLNK